MNLHLHQGHCFLATSGSILLSNGTYTRKSTMQSMKHNTFTNPLSKSKCNHVLEKLARNEIPESIPQPDKDAHTAAEDVRNEDIRSEIREAHTEG